MFFVIYLKTEFCSGAEDVSRTRLFVGQNACAVNLPLIYLCAGKKKSAKITQAKMKKLPGSVEWSGN